jgi:hypothetical protein
MFVQHRIDELPLAGPELAEAEDGLQHLLRIAELGGRRRPQGRFEQLEAS